MIKGEVALLDKDFDQATCTWYWRATIWFDEESDLRLGKCEVHQ